MTIRCDEFRRCLIVDIRDKASEVLRKTHEFKYADQLAVGRRGEGTFEVKVTQDNVPLVGVGVLHTEDEVGYRP